MYSGHRHVFRAYAGKCSNRCKNGYMGKLEATERAGKSLSFLLRSEGARAWLGDHFRVFHQQGYIPIGSAPEKQKTAPGAWTGARSAALRMLKSRLVN